MKNVFIFYAPPTNQEAMIHYEATIRRPVESARILKYTDQRTSRKLQLIFGNRAIPIWGQEDKPGNRPKFDKMKEGDYIMLVEGPSIKLLGHIACKTESKDLSRELWPDLRGNTDRTWPLIYFIANAKEIDLPFVEFCRLFGYQENYQLRGFTTVADDRLAAFYERYDDLYSILMRLKEGMEVEEVSAPAPIAPEPIALSAEEIPEEDISDHVRMQWKLLKMGRKSGAQVWAPRNDQGKITRTYEFNGFEETFAAGLDTQTKYVENIDVVWKEEFRIDAAFEIENSTAIYSGLLRFADLTMVAPNTLYPMFIVAPSSKRQRVMDQLSRPSFRKLKISSKVRYLSYEAVDEIDNFFGEKATGLNVNVLMDKAEQLEVA